MFPIRPANLALAFIDHPVLAFLIPVPFDDGAVKFTNDLLEYPLQAAIAGGKSGQGFFRKTRHHGIPSAYSAFGRYLSERDHETSDIVERYFYVDNDFWSEFEQRLASFDSDTLIEDAAQFLVSYSADNWSDSSHHDYQFEINRVVKSLSSTTQSYFAEWIRQLPIPDPAFLGASRLPIDLQAKFLNFNYTSSLQQLYAVEDVQILHIHGPATDPNAALVLGHGWEQENLDPYRFETDPEDADMRVVEGVQLIDEYFKSTFKPSQQIIDEHQAFFENLNNVRKIFVMGHSLSDVDLIYFREIIRCVDFGQVRWMVSYYGDLSQTRQRFAALGINPALVQFALLQDFKFPNQENDAESD